jgi:hypothetical protein
MTVITIGLILSSLALAYQVYWLRKEIYKETNPFRKWVFKNNKWWIENE